MAEAGLDAPAMFKALNDGESPGFHHSYAGGFGTLHTMVCDPVSRTLTVGIGANAAPNTFNLGRWQSGSPFAVHSLRGTLGTGKDRRFVDRDLAGAEFRNASLSEARFENINFAGAEITANCNFKGMRIAGLLVEDLFAAYGQSLSKL
jgi:Pentapeptide repeats (8 copies)